MALLAGYIGVVMQKRYGIIANADIIKLGRKSERAALGNLQRQSKCKGIIPVVDNGPFHNVTLEQIYSSS